MAEATQNGDATRRVILDLNTLVPDRPIIRIDGADYECRVKDDFGIEDLTRLERLKERYNTLVGKESFTDEEGRWVSEGLREFTAMVLTAPPEVQSKLTDNHRLAVVQAFLAASGVQLPPVPANRAAKRTQAKSSRSARGSTAAIRSDGSG